ncbi:CDGSH-type Zn-finger protein [Caldalkalibacillus uzonensis]|uniref:CDGSH-type Zn-finger protein n=1 Tax=Caldalkalibacillus uzonensis TaxID=353224 RepID=A0ABU0CTM3_9BACI|nr:CDGSH iron-sulfur domain-containing protein [Caldalkalibacillus uzonensis]MDQ0339725.1 CDGSH-type Zn-finger protein [Caldalkalibacillus uzonensis]
MSEVKVTINDNGPIAIKGEIELYDGEGQRIETKKATFLCRCGLSGNKPFCDGSHKGKFENKVRAK